MRTDSRAEWTTAASPALPGVQRALRGRWWVPALLSVAIALWQFSFNSAPPQSRAAHAMTGSMGLSPDVPYYFYFFHHFGVFPVGALEVPRLGPSKQAAAEFVAHHGDRLRMDFGWPVNTPRFGDYGKLFLLYPDLWLRGDPGHASAIPANEMLFIGALLAVFWAFWREGHRRLGVLIVVLVGSNPFQLVETYGRGNVFSIPISLALLALAAHLGFLTGRRGVTGSAWAIAIASGAAFASFREIRAEAAVMASSALVTYLIARAPLIRRLLLAGAFLLAFGITGRAWSGFWADQFTRAERFVADAGGRTFRTPGGTHHALWHALYCGLGDYGTDRGFHWDDRTAFRWATTYDPASNPTPIPYHYTRGYYFDETYDGLHHVAPTDLPEYNALVRARVLAEVRRDPLWYAGVLFRRCLAILRDATPAALSIGPVTLGIPGAGWLLVPVLLFTMVRRQTFHRRIILFVLPLSAVALIVFSGKGTTFYGISHLVALACAIDLFALSRRAIPAQEASHVP